MKIVVIGLGHLGSTVAACAATDGHDVVGVNSDHARCAAVDRGRAPVFEPGLAALLAAGVAAGRLRARPDLGDSIAAADLALICVGTPAQASGALDLTDVVAATSALGQALRSRAASASPLVVAVRSTLPPGAMVNVVVPTLEQASAAAGTRFEAAYNPEGLREGSAIDDYRQPSRIVIGERAPGATGRLRGLYDAVDAPLFELSYAAAELVKLADNSFHALKVAFANEIGRYAAEIGVDAAQWAEVFIADQKLNVSTAYLRPGGAFGGACLEKDTAALAHALALQRIDGPLLPSIVASNRAHAAHVVRTVLRELRPGAEILLHGIGFKSGVNDLRRSPAIDLAMALVAAGHRVRLCDPDATVADEISARLPSSLAACWVDDVERAAGQAEVIVLWKLWTAETPVPSRAAVFDLRALRFGSDGNSDVVARNAIGGVARAFSSEVETGSRQENASPPD